MERPLGRVRVAVSIPAANPDVRNNGEFGIHVGHARTLYLGKLFAESKGLPYHVRIDGARLLFGADLSLFAVDVQNCLAFLGIQPDRFYWAPQWDELLHGQLEKLFGKWEPVVAAFSATRFTGVPAVIDDLLNPPSWIVRGREFVDKARYNGREAQVMMMTAHTRLEECLYEQVGQEMLQWNVPLITMGGMKLAKSEGRVIPWGVLKMLDQEQLHRFLLSTAVYPEDPLSVRREALGIDGVGVEPWEWNWDTFKEFAK